MRFNDESFRFNACLTQLIDADKAVVTVQGPVLIGLREEEDFALTCDTRSSMPIGNLLCGILHVHLSKC